jgi:hypothetical protein
MKKPPYGNSSPCCCFVCTKDASHSLVLAFFVAFPTVVFVTTVVPGTEWWSIVIACVLCLLSFVMLICAVGLDPGIIPPASVTGRAFEPGQEVTITHNGQTVQVRVCHTCLVPKPPGSSHCTFCDYCVEDYDHHCGVLGSCVAKRTFRFFGYFFDVTAVLAAYVFIRSCLEASSFDFDTANDSHFLRWKAVAIVGCIGYTALTGCCVAGQSMMYTKLSCDGTTQKELFGGQNQRRRQQQRERGEAVAADPMMSTERMSCGNYFQRKCGALGTPTLAQYTTV